MAKYRVLVCSRCHRLFKALTYMDICPLCLAEDDKVFRVVKSYLRKNRKATIVDVCEHCQVEEKQVLKWVREERLYFSEESGTFLDCLKCGAEIQTGKYCAKCKQGMVKNVEAGILALDKMVNQSKSSGMHYKKGRHKGQ